MDRQLVQIGALIPPHEAALTPCLPPALRRVIESGMQSDTLPTALGGGIVLHERLDWLPPIVDEHLRGIAAMAYDKLLEHLEAIDEAKIPLIIARLKAHNWRYSRRHGSEIAEADLDIDWVEDLCEFPEWAINRACREWRRTREEPPIIAGIRRLCEDAVRQDRMSLRLLRRLLDVQHHQNQAA